VIVLREFLDNEIIIMNIVNWTTFFKYKKNKNGKAMTMSNTNMENIEQKCNRM